MSQPNQKVERECSLCNKIRGIYEFSASQRRKGDDAACLRCIPEIQNVRPGHLKHEEDNSDAKYIAHTSTANNSATGSFYNKTGGVSLTTSRSTAMTAGSGNATAVSTGTSTRTSAGTYNRAGSSAAGSSHFSTTTNNSEAPPTYTLRQTGWVHIPNGFCEENVPDLADDDVETFRDGSDDEDYDM